MNTDQSNPKPDTETMDEAERARKQARYEELCAKFDNEEEEITDAEIAESTRLYYELHPEEQYWRETHPDLTPADLWPLPSEEEPAGTQSFVTGANLREAAGPSAPLT